MVSIIPGIWSARVQWQDDRNFPCFHSQACGLEYYLYWQLLSGGSQEINNAITTSTVYTITDLHPAVEYSFTMNVGCKNDPSLKSGNFTISVFTTKGTLICHIQCKLYDIQLIVAYAYICLSIVVSCFFLITIPL